MRVKRRSSAVYIIPVLICALVAWFAIHRAGRGTGETAVTPEATEPSTPPAAAPPFPVRLPVARTAEPLGDEDYIRVALGAEREVFAGGQRMSWPVLTEYLQEHAEEKRELDENRRPSARAVLLSADREAWWRDVQWTLEACADKGVRIYRVYLAVLDADGEPAVLPVILPKDPTVPREEVATLMVELRHVDDEAGTRIKLLDSILRPGDRGFAELDREIGQILENFPGLPASLDGRADIPVVDAVRTLDAFRRHGITEITFLGAPPPGRPR